MQKLLTEWRKYLVEAWGYRGNPTRNEFDEEAKKLNLVPVKKHLTVREAEQLDLPTNQVYQVPNTCRAGVGDDVKCEYLILRPTLQASPRVPAEPQKGPEAEIAKIKEELSKLKMPAGSVEMASLSDKSHARSPKITFKESLAGYILLTSRAVLVNCVSKKCKGHPLFGGKFSDKAAMATPLGKKCKQICIKDNSKLQLWAKSLLFGPKCKKLADRVVLHRGEIIAFSDMKSVQQHLLPCMDSMVMAGLNRRSRKGLSWQRYHVLIKALKKQRQPRRAGVERWWDISGLDGFGLPVGSEQLLTGPKVRRWYRKGLKIKRKQRKLKRRLKELEKSRQ